MHGLKKLLGIGHKTKPVLMQDVQPAAQKPEDERKVNEAVGKLVKSLVDLERKSYMLRRQLSTMSLHIVAQPNDPSRREDHT